MNTSEIHGIIVNKSLTFKAFNGRPKLGCSEKYLRDCLFSVQNLNNHPKTVVTIRNISFNNICIATIIGSYVHVVIESCTSESNTNQTAIKIRNETMRVVSVMVLNSAFVGTSRILGKGQLQSVSVWIINTSFVRSCFGILLNIRENPHGNIYIRNSTFRSISSYAIAYHQIDFPKFSQVQINITNCKFIGNAEHHMLDRFRAYESVSIRSSHIQNYLPDCPDKREKFSANTNQLMLFVKDCRFIGGDFGISVGNMTHNTTIDIKGSVFYDHIASGFRYHESYSYSTFSRASIKMEDSEFLRNGIPNEHPSLPHGGLIIRGSNGFLTDVLIRNSTFVENHARISGGAVYINKARATLLNCTFTKNYAGIHEDRIDHYSFGTGGAIFLGADCSVRIQNCFMKGNYARYGSAVFQIFGYCSNLFELLDTQILPSTFSRVLSLGAVQAYPSSKLKIRNTEIRCPEQSKISLQNFLQNYFAVDCKSCPHHTYSLDSGVANISCHESGKNSRINVTPVKCHECPFGALCVKGLIKSKSNFWKYVCNKRAHFLICPSFYCKGEDEVKTAANHCCVDTRIGTLCGRCREEYTENLFSSFCIQKKLCKPHWFWLLLFAVSSIYLLFLMFLPEIAQFFKCFLRFPHNRPSAKRMSLISSLLPSNKGQKEQDIPFQSDETNALDPFIVKRNPASKSSDGSFVGGIIKVMSFYYQVDILFDNYGSKPNRNVIVSIMQALHSVFNLSPFGSNLSALGCPFEKMNVVNKYIMKSSLPLSIFILAGTIYCVKMVTQYIRQCILLEPLNSERNKSLQTRLLCTILQTIVLSYSMVTSNLFSLITCVSLPPDKKVLFVDGNISCYLWWQHVLIAFIVIWVFPLGISLITATKLLKRRSISVKKFFFSLIIPLPMNVFFILCHFLRGSFHRQINDDTEINESNIAGDSTGTEEKLLFILQGPFQKSNSLASHLYWDAVLIFQRLILLIMHAFIIVPIGKAYSMFVTIILFFGYHLRVFPFQSLLLNVIQSITLFFICVKSGINLFDAYMYVHGTHISGPLATTSNIFRIVVTVMHLFFPLLILFIVFCVIIVHCINFIFHCLRSLASHLCE